MQQSIHAREKHTVSLLLAESFKWRFHRPMNHTDERHKTADEWNFEKKFGRCNRFVKSADQYY